MIMTVLTPTCQCEFGEVVAGVSPCSRQQGDGRVCDVFAVSQVEPLQLRHVALQQPQNGLTDVQTGQTQSHHVSQSAARRLRTYRYRHRWSRDLGWPMRTLNFL